MARIRTIKIGFFRNEDLAVFSFAHRLLFEGLWLLADRDGRLEDRPRRIKADLFPFDAAIDVDAMLSDLAGGSDPFIARYEVDGRRYIQVLKFEKHQRPHHTEPASILPSQEEADILMDPEPHREDPESHGEDPEQDGGHQEGKEGKGREGKGKEGGESPRLTPRPASSADLADRWNALTSPPIPKCLELTDQRKRASVSRLRERPLAAWEVVIGRINASAFCRGDNDRGWVATFDWLVKAGTAVKVLEGKYDNRPRVSGYVAAHGPPDAAAELRRAWKDECRSEHASACPNANYHAARMAASA